jgi:hypothetical protein
MSPASKGREFEIGCLVAVVEHRIEQDLAD